MHEEFDRDIILENITFLLNESNKRIGELESEVGVSTGYISRITKDEKTKPGIDFIYNAAKFFHISIDTLLKVKLGALTSTERYLVSFLEKLNTGTLDDTLDWDVEHADELNQAETDMNGYVEHPLLSYEHFQDEDKNGYPTTVSGVVFMSKSFGFNTVIAGDCFNLPLENNSLLYIMNIKRSNPDSEETTHSLVKEIWMYMPQTGLNFLCCNNRRSTLAVLVENLYSTISESMKHPKLKKETKQIIDSFMGLDFNDIS